MSLDADDRAFIRELITDKKPSFLTPERIMLIAAVVGAVVNGYFGHGNSQKLDTVDEKQVAVVRKADEVKADLDHAAKVNEDATAVILNGNYVYQARQLEEAINDGLPSAEIKIRRDRARESKRVYDEYVKKKQESKP